MNAAVSPRCTAEFKENGMASAVWLLIVSSKRLTSFGCSSAFGTSNTLVDTIICGGLMLYDILQVRNYLP